MSIVKGKLQDMFWDLGDHLGFFFFKKKSNLLFAPFFKILNNKLSVKYMRILLDLEL